MSEENPLRHLGEVFKLTKREYFSVLILNGYFGNSIMGEDAALNPSKAAQWAVETADELINELKKEKV